MKLNIMSTELCMVRIFFKLKSFCCIGTRTVARFVDAVVTGGTASDNAGRPQGRYINTSRLAIRVQAQTDGVQLLC